MLEQPPLSLYIHIPGVYASVPTATLIHTQPLPVTRAGIRLCSVSGLRHRPGYSSWLTSADFILFLLVEARPVCSARVPMNNCWIIFGKKSVSSAGRRSLWRLIRAQPKLRSFVATDKQESIASHWYSEFSHGLSGQAWQNSLRRGRKSH